MRASLEIAPQANHADAAAGAKLRAKMKILVSKYKDLRVAWAAEKERSAASIQKLSALDDAVAEATSLRKKTEEKASISETNRQALEVTLRGATSRLSESQAEITALQGRLEATAMAASGEVRVRVRA